MPIPAIIFQNMACFALVLRPKIVIKCNTESTNGRPNMSRGATERDADPAGIGRIEKNWLDGRSFRKILQKVP